MGMKNLRKPGLAFLFTWIAGFMVCGNAHPVPAETLDFAVIQPGQPGNSGQAQPVMDALALYIQDKLDNTVSIKGHYFNKLEEALHFMKETPPAWGIVRLGFYCEHAQDLGMVPIASTLPEGLPSEQWRLVTRKEGPDDWRNLKGQVLGNMLFEQKAAAFLLFGEPVQKLPFQLEGTYRPLKSLRQVAAGKAAAAALDGAQYRAGRGLGVFENIKVIHTSQVLPSDPVVWFGKPGPWTERLSGILLGIEEDPEALSLLRLLQTKGFGPANKDLSSFQQDKTDGACFQ